MAETEKSTDSAKHRTSEGRGEGVSAGGVPGVYHGVVSGYLKSNELFMVKTQQEGRVVPHKCVWAAGYFSNLMGFNSNFAPCIGTEVIVFIPEGGQPYIIGSSPNSHYIDRTGLNRRLTTGGKGELENAQWSTQQYFPHLRQNWMKGDKPELSSNIFNYGGMPAGDLMEGEIDIQNAMGVGLSLVRHFAMLKGGDLAKVEASVIDDMVRIISHTFRHFSSFGDYKILNDGGRLNVIWDGTTCDWEAYGKDSESEERAPLQAKDIIDVEKEKFKNLARWRFSSYIGFLGDFINLFVTDKLKVTSPEVHMERSGKGRMHVNEDGSFLVQSVNDIVLERVCRIPVPLQKKAEHDPDGDGFITNGELPYPSDKEPIKCWDWNKSGGVEKSFWCVFQLRDYGRWFSNYYSKGRFQQLKEDWDVPSEAATPKPRRVDDEEIDKEEANAGIPEGPITHDQVYSAIRLYRDGSISLSDGFENTITMSRNGISLASSTNLQLEAAGSVNIVAGRDVNLVGKNSVEASALRGGISLRGENWIQQFSKGGILIESESFAGDTIWNDDNIDDPESDQEDQYKIGGICIWSKNSSLRLISAADMGLRTDYGKQIFAGFHQIWKSDLPMVFNDQLALVGGVTLVKDLLWADMHMVKDLYSGNLVEIFGIPVHVLGDTIDEEKIVGPSDKPNVAAIFDSAKEISSAFRERDWAAKFMYRTREELGTEKEDATSNQAVYESLSQQGLRMGVENKPLKTDDSYGSWNLPLLAELPGRRAAWPGIGKQHWILPNNLGDPKLHAPTGLTTFNNHSVPLTLTDMNLKNLL